MISIVVNGEIKKIDSVINLKDLLVLLELPDERIAIEINQNVVRKKDWVATTVGDSDRLEIIHFVGGG